jgi:NAD(P)-dependent dehydrogenase (short-subunit alcohol dehydrogenase family)
MANSGPDKRSLAGRAFVVLGTGAGIGGEVCGTLAEAGAQLLCVDLDEAAARRVGEAIGGVGMAADITDRSAMEAVFAKAEDLFGSSLHGVVDVVGVPVPGALAQQRDEDYDRQFDLVLRHAWLTISIAAPMLARRGAGSIVFIGSTGGFNHFPGVSLYCTAKAALHSLARNAAVEFAPDGVRINVVAPGRVRDSGVLRPPEELWSRIGAGIPMRRVGFPAEVASAVLYLASDMSSYVTGEILVVDGGMINMTSMPNPKS